MSDLSCPWFVGEPSAPGTAAVFWWHGDNAGAAVAHACSSARGRLGA
jgi:hypothetical protein